VSKAARTPRMAPLAFHFTHYRSPPMLRPAATGLFAGLIALGFAGNALADARTSVHAAFQKNMSAKTYRAAMTDLASGKSFSTVEVKGLEAKKPRQCRGFFCFSTCP